VVRGRVARLHISVQKSYFGYILEDLENENVGIGSIW
jgi:hypothetical protein